MKTRIAIRVIKALLVAVAAFIGAMTPNVQDRVPNGAQSTKLTQPG